MLQERSRLYVFNKTRLSGLGRIAVVGDLHGDYRAFSALQQAVNPVEDGIIFLGDYADMGPNGVEVIEGVRSLIRKYPRSVVALKGNHENYTEDGDPMFGPCTLDIEVASKGRSWQKYFHDEFESFVDKLYLAAIIPGETLFVHGGISDKIKRQSDLRHPTKGIEYDILWSDPFNGYGQQPSMRGGDCIEFGKDVTSKVCDSLGVKRIIRSHQPRKARTGPFYEHDNKIVTTSCTSCYDGDPFVLFVDTKNPSNLSVRTLYENL